MAKITTTWMRAAIVALIVLSTTTVFNVLTPTTVPAALVGNSTHGRIRLSQEFYVYAVAGERVEYSFNPVEAGASIVTVVGPTGLIKRCVNTDACTDFFVSPQTGVYKIGFENNAALDLTLWSIAVKATASSAALSGRVWSEGYKTRQLGDVPPRDFDFWYVHESGVVYRAKYRGLHGIDGRFEANQFGILPEKSPCAPRYQSLTSQLTALPPECPGDALVFFENPASDLPANAPGPRDAVTDPVTPYTIKPPYADPTIPMLQFANSSPLSAAGTFSADVRHFEGFAHLEVDTDNNGSYADPVDRKIPWPIDRITVTPNLTSIAFDGIDGAGQPIPPGRTFPARLRIDRTGELHFLRVDIEVNSGGIEVEALTGPHAGTPNADLIYWDDTDDDLHESCVRFSKTPIPDGTAGFHSTGGIHGWPKCPDLFSGWGDQNMIDDWTYAAVNVQASTLINPPRLELDKTAVSVTDTDGDGIVTAVYRIEVKNPSTVPVTYELVDNPAPDSDIPIVSGAATVATSAGTAPATPPNFIAVPWRLATGATIPADATHTYTVTLQLDANAVTAGAPYAGCGATPGPGTGLYNSATVTYPTGTKTDDLCAELPLVTIDKTFVSAVGLTGPNYTVTYTVAVHNFGGPTTYNLSDTPGFDSDITVTSATATVVTSATPPPAPAAPAPFTTAPWTLATNANIGTGQTHTYTLRYRVNAATPIGNPSSLSSCATTPTPGTGLTNTATLTYPGATKTDRACGNLPLLTIDKAPPVLLTDVDGDTVIDVGDTLRYTIVATNAGQIPLTGVTVRDTLIPTARLSCTVNPGGAVFPNVAGGRLAVGGSITCTANLVVTDTHANAGKIDNTATTDSTETPPAKDDVTTPIPPEVVVTKTSAAPESLGNNQFRITSTITVTSTGSRTTYNLDDTLSYGTGITINSATATNSAPGTVPIVAGFNGTTSRRIATAVAIGHNVTHTYQVVVTATVSPATTAANQRCAANSGTGGFANRATVTFTTRNSTADACVEPPVPDMAVVKTITSGPTLQTGGSYEINYQVVATNLTAGVGTYDLSDTLAFGTGVTVNSASVASKLPATLTHVAAWNGTTNTLLADDQPVSGLAVHTYNITVNVSGSSSLTPAQAECQTGTTAGGLRNNTGVTDGDGTRTSTVCAPVPVPKLTITKTIASGPTPLANGDYTVAYDITVNNISTAPTTYDLTDQLRYGTGITVVNAAATSTSVTTNLSAWNGTTATTLVTGQPIAGSATHTYRINTTGRLTAVAPVSTSSARDCDTTNDGPGGTGFSNRAGLTSNGTSIGTVDACAPAPPPSLNITKTFDNLSQVGLNFTATYRVVITNSGGGNGSYQLSDTLQFGSTITVNSATFTSSPDLSAFYATPLWTGTGAVTTPNVVIAGTDTTTGVLTHTYTFTVTGSFPSTPPGTAEDCTLDPGETGTGLRNESTLSSPFNPDLKDDACQDPPDPKISIDKSIATGPTLQANGTYNISYLVRVANSGGAGVYDLADTLQFGGGISPTTATIINTLPGGLVLATPAWNGTTNTTVVTAQAIAPGATHTYRVDVNATLTSTFVPVVSSACPPPGSGNAGGFANTAKITVSTVESSDDACAPFPNPALTFTKRITNGPTDLGGGVYSLTYQVTAQNTGQGPDRYNLTDEFRFGAGITVVTASITSTSAGVTPLATWNGLTQTAVVTGQLLPAMTTHVFTVNVTANTNTVTDIATTLCDTTGMNTAGGLRNIATIDSTPLDATRTDCAPVPNPILSINKGIVGGPTLVPMTNNRYRVTYEINVVNSGLGSTVYSLADSINFGTGITVVGTPTVTGEVVGGAALTTLPWTPTGPITTNAPIAAESHHRYHLVVEVEVSGSTTLNARDCDLNTGTGGTGLLNNATLSGPRTADQSASACAPVPAPNIKLTKSITDGPTLNTDGTYQITYTVAVANTGVGIGEYDLTERPNFGGGLTIVSGTIASPEVTGEATTLNITGTTPVIADAAIAAEAIHTYTIVVTVALNPATFVADNGTCAVVGSGTAGGFLNIATVDSTTGTQSGEACAPVPPPLTAITKVLAGPPTDLGGGRFQVGYTITVANTGDGPDVYDLDDELRFGAGITITSATITSNDSLTVNPAWTGLPAPAGVTRVISGQFLGGQRRHTYAVVAVVDANALTNEEASRCDETGMDRAGGLRNLGTVHASSDSTDSVCADLPRPQLGLTKAISVAPAPVAGVLGSYTLTYQLVVANTGDGSTTYDLADQFAFGTGITSITNVVTTASTNSVVPPAPTAWVTGTNLATGQPISGNSTHTYTVVAQVAVAPNTTLAARDCTTTDSANTGLTNNATLKSPSTVDLTDTDCAAVPAPLITIDKTVATQAVHVSGNEFRIVYQVVVANTGNAPGMYDLNDHAAFGRGLATISASAQSSDVTLATPLWDGLANLDLVRNQEIPHGTRHTYMMTFLVAVAPDLTHAMRDCHTGSNGLASGLLNVAAVTWSDRVATDNACGELPDAEMSITKTVVGTPTRNADGTFNVSYEIVARHIGGAPTLYRMTEEPKFGTAVKIISATITSADVELPTPPFWAPLQQSFLVLEDQPINVAEVDRYIATYVVQLEMTPTTVFVSCGAPNSPPGAPQILNTAELVPVDGVHSLDNECVGLPGPTLTIAKTAVLADPTPRRDGLYTAKYTITVTNAGDGPGTYTLTDTFDFAPGTVVKAVRVTSPPPGVVPNADFNGASQPELAKATIPAQTTHTYLLEVDADVSAVREVDKLGCTHINATGLRNTAKIETQEAAACVEVPPVVDLHLTKKVSTNVAVMGETVVYTLVVGNDGPTNATGVSVTDALPAGLEYVSDDRPGAFNSGTGVWTVGRLDVGQHETLRITARVMQLRTIVNIAEITTGDQPDIDSSPANGAPGEDDIGSTSMRVTELPPPEPPAEGLIPRAGSDAGKISLVALAFTLFGAAMLTGKRLRRPREQAS